MKVLIITCYHDPDYVRARSIRQAVDKLPNVEARIVKNKQKNALRYLEIIYLVVRQTLSFKPDIYLLTFRGQEILPLILFISRKKPVVFDEFIVPLAWASDENRAKTFINQIKIIIAKIASPLYKKWLRKVRIIISDTESHAKLSSSLSGVNLNKYVAVPVGTDEAVFKPRRKETSNNFNVFFYGGMYPLHGLKYILESAVSLQENPEISFTIIGGDQTTLKEINLAKQRGANINYKKRVPFEELPKYINVADICLAGPFGNTPQSQRVITGKTYQFLACGAPVLLGDNQEVRKLFTDKKNCLIASQADSDSIKNKIMYAFMNPIKLKNIGTHGLETYQTNFSSENISKELNSIFQNIS
jgi:glycosyltransferase involved in cell wall biosynthesis